MRLDFGDLLEGALHVQRVKLFLLDTVGHQRCFEDETRPGWQATLARELFNVPEIGPVRRLVVAVELVGVVNHPDADDLKRYPFGTLEIVRH